MSFSQEASTTIASKPRTKFGTEISVARPTEIAWLNAALGLAALTIPNGIPSPTTITAPHKTSRAEYPNRLSQ